MEWKDLLRVRRSIRDFEDREVNIETVREIIDDCTLAPSASNEQPCRYIIIRDKALIKRISDESKKNLLADIASIPGHPSTRYEGVLKQEVFNVFYNAPCLTIITGPQGHRSLREDIGLAAAYFMMGASSRGLGTCWINLGSVIRDPGLIKEIGIPEGHAVVAPLIVGYPRMIPTASPRNHEIVVKEIP